MRRMSLPGAARRRASRALSAIRRWLRRAGGSSLGGCPSGDGTDRVRRRSSERLPRHRLHAPWRGGAAEAPAERPRIPPGYCATAGPKSLDGPHENVVVERWLIRSFARYVLAHKPECVFRQPAPTEGYAGGDRYVGHVAGDTGAVCADVGLDRRAAPGASGASLRCRAPAGSSRSRNSAVCTITTSDRLPDSWLATGCWLARMRFREGQYIAAATHRSHHSAPQSR
jgi:hypothetical protein